MLTLLLTAAALLFTLAWLLRRRRKRTDALLVQPDTEVLDFTGPDARRRIADAPTMDTPAVKRGSRPVPKPSQARRHGRVSCLDNQPSEEVLAERRRRRREAVEAERAKA